MIDDDSKLRPLFDALKAEDARAVRRFSSYWEAARETSGRDRWPLNLTAVAAALALLLIGAVAVYTRGARQDFHHPISEWRSPTASLLNTPGKQFFISMPRMEEPLVPSSVPSIKEQRN